MASPFSPETREATLAALPAAALDVLVIGGGITGAGVARDAALRGLRVALVERLDWAAGTSSRSLKLIHGGVRYLEQGDLGLVREAARERSVLRRLAPHLALPVRLLMPTYGRAGHAKLGLGLWTFEHIATVAPEERHAMWSREEALEREPTLDGTRLHGAATFVEYLTDDARLVLETVLGAHAAGALCVNHVEATEIAGGEAAWAGIRPLLHEEGKRPSEISRKDEIMVSDTGLVSIAGGKLTTHRRMAERVVDLVVERLGRVAGACRTASVPLPNGGLAPEELPRLLERVRARLPQLAPGGAAPLVALQGAGAERIVARALTSPAAGEVLPGGILRAEIAHALDEEMALTLEDLLERRTRLLLFDPGQGLACAAAVADMAAARLGWDRARTAAELEGYRALAASLRRFA